MKIVPAEEITDEYLPEDELTRIPSFRLCEKIILIRKHLYHWGVRVTSTLRMIKSTSKNIVNC